eukprot:jgi/Hompol1/1393/HPOL_004535-RA
MTQLGKRSSGFLSWLGHRSKDADDPKQPSQPLQKLESLLPLPLPPPPKPEPLLRIHDPVRWLPGSRFAGAVDMFDLITRLPVELFNHVIHFSDPITKYLLLAHINGRPPALSETQLKILWSDCFLLDAVYAVKLLPKTMLTWEVLFVMSNRMMIELGHDPNIMRESTLAGALQLPRHSSSFSSALQSRIVRACLARQDLGQSLWAIACKFPQHILLRQDLQPTVLLLAVAAGDLPAVEFSPLLTSSRPPNIDCAIVLAASFDHADILSYLRQVSQRPPTFDWAIEANNFDALKNIIKYYPDTLKNFPIEAAVKNRANAMLVWMYEHTPLLTMSRYGASYRLQAHAIKAENLELLIYAAKHKIGESFTKKYEEFSPAELEWINNNVPKEYTLLNGSIDEAAVNGHSFRVRQLLKIQSATFTTIATDAAASQNDLDLFQTLLDGRDNIGCSLASVDAAISHNNPTLLRLALAYQSHVPFSKYIYAASRGSLGIIRALYEYDSTVDWLLVYQCLVAVDALSAAEWLKSKLSYSS